mgnify:CR=1 FL=1
MPNIKSAIKRYKTSLIRNQRNSKRRVTMRTYIKKLRKETDYENAVKLLPKVFSTIDKTAKAGVIHKRTADRYKSRLSQLVSKMKEGESS